MENKQSKWAATAVAALVLGGGFYLAQTDSNQEVVTVSPEKQVVKEGFSGQKGPDNVVITHKEFTGAQKVIVVSPEKQEVVKEGFSGQKAPIESHKDFTAVNHGIVINPEPAVVVSGYSKAPQAPVLEPTLMPVPEPAKAPQATPMATPVIQKTPKVDQGIVIRKTIEDLEAIINELKGAIKQ